jgi:NitT/TauT family transport system permease protein
VAVVGNPLTTINEQALRTREVHGFRLRRRRSAVAVFVWRVVVLVVLLVGWYYASGRVVDSLFVSNPVDVGRAFGDEVSSGQLTYHVRFTLIAVVLGYAIGAVSALVAAALVTLNPTAHGALRPYLMALYATPTIAIAPLVIVWFGFDLTPKVLIAAIFVFFIVFMMAVAGIQSVPAGMVDVVRVMGASRAQLLRKIVFPSAVPQIITALRIAIPEAMVGVVIGEFIGGNRGVGYLIVASAGRYNTAAVFASIAAVLAIVLAMDTLLTLVERTLGGWRGSATGAGVARP